MNVPAPSVKTVQKKIAATTFTIGAEQQVVHIVFIIYCYYATCSRWKFWEKPSMYIQMLTDGWLTDVILLED